VKSTTRALHDRSETGNMNDEGALHKKAREAIQSGRLPAMKPSRTWGGPGSGTPCSVCGESVTQGQMELEIEYRRNGNGRPGLDNYYFHIRCFAVWECESQHHRAPGTISANGARDPTPLSTAASE
jgi:hypothetical protein